MTGWTISKTKKTITLTLEDKQSAYTLVFNVEGFQRFLNDSQLIVASKEEEDSIKRSDKDFQ